MKKSAHVVHVIAVCDQCGDLPVGVRNGQAVAALHAKHYRHRVKVEIGLACTYDAMSDPLPAKQRRARA